MSRAFPFFVACLLSSSAIAAPPITAAAFTPGNQQVIVASQAGIEVRTWPELQASGKIETDLANIHDLAFSPDGQRLLIAGGSPGERGVIEVISWPKKERTQQVAEPTDVVYRVAWSPDGQQFATAGGDGICRVFDANTGKHVSRYEGHSRAVLAIAYLPGGRTIVSAGVDQTLQLWEGSTGKQLRSQDNHLGAVNDLAVRPISNRDLPPIVASCSDDRTVRFWQPTIGRLIRFARLPSPPRCLAWSSDGKQILAGCNDGGVRRIDFESTEVTQQPDQLAGRIHVVLTDANDRLFLGGEGSSPPLR